jgi:hypothetical protein
MAKNTGAALALVGGAITFSNEWLSGNVVNWRILVATPLAAGFLFGVGEISEPIATGLGIAILATCLFTPFASGSSPVNTLNAIAGSPKNG